MQSTAVTLNKEIKINQLSKNIKNRDSEQILYEKGIKKKANLSNKLQPNAKELENAQITDKLNKNIRKRDNEQKIFEKGIKKNPNLSNKLQSNTSELKNKIIFNLFLIFY